MKLLNRILCASLVATLTACGGGSGGGTVTPSMPIAQSTPPSGSSILPNGGKVGTVTASATVSSGYALGAKSSERKIASLRNTQGYTISSVQVDGTIYPGYAGSTPVTNTQTLIPVSNQVAINMSFSNVPAGNNAFMVLHLQAVAPDGSKFDLGYLASLVNITNGANTPVTLTAATTQTFEVFNSLLVPEILSSTDLQDANLATYLTSQIAASGQTPDPATGLFTPVTMRAIDATLATHFSRGLSVNVAGAPDGTQVNFIPDFTNAGELALGTNRVAIQTAFPLIPSAGIGGPALAPCNGQSLPHTGPSIPPGTAVLSICGLPVQTIAGAATLPNVYGGPLIVIAQAYNSTSSSFMDGTLNIASIPLGGTLAANLSPTSAVQNITVTDPEAWAFPTQYCNPTCNYNVASDLSSFNVYQYPNTNLNTSSRAVTATPFNASSNVVHLNPQSPIGAPASTLQFCTDGIDPCVPLAGLTNFEVRRSFADWGTNFSYFNWQPGPGTTSVSQAYNNYGGSCKLQGMVVNTGGAATGSFSTTTPAYFRSGTNIYLFGNYVYPTNACNTSNSDPLRTPATWTATLTDSGGNTYTATYTPTAVGYGYTVFSFPSITGTVKLTKIVFAYSVPSGTTPPQAWGIYYIASQ